MAPPKQKIDISPSEVVLDLQTSTSPSATLTLRNTSDDENLLFKVRTTNPRRYLVKPNQELIMAGSSATVTIQMQSRECQEILDHGLQESEAKGKDKFMISTIVADDQILKTLKSAKETGAKELQAAFSDIWASHGKDDTANRRIAVDFVLPKTVATPGVNTAVTPAASNGAAASAPTSTAKAAPKTEKAAPAPATNAAAQASPISLATVAASQIQTPNKKADEVIDKFAQEPASSKGGDVELSYETLTKQYKDTLATLVQVTEERDRIQQKFKEVSREMTQLKEEVRTSNKGRANGEVETLAMTKSGYHIWHLVLVAMVSFLVAKLMELSRNEFNSSK